MTNEEALEFAKGGLNTYLEKYPHLTKQIEFQKIVVKALKKTIAERPLNADITSEHGYGICPSCGENIDIVESFSYCDYCGQKIDWNNYL